MQFLKKTICPFMFTIACLLLMTGSAISGDVAAAVKAESPKIIAATPDAQKPARSIVVTYFHTTMRCPTCHTIEELSTNAVKYHFENELKTGTVVWRVINVDEPENAHYNKDYQLYTKSLIVSEMKDGKEARWKNLDKIWVFVRDEEKFDQYVQTEIAGWLKE
jgi:hypothetical protein